MFWSEPDDAEEEEEEALLCSPALMARRASESWIVAPPVEVPIIILATNSTAYFPSSPPIPINQSIKKQTLNYKKKPFNVL